MLLCHDGTILYYYAAAAYFTILLCRGGIILCYCAAAAYYAIILPREGDVLPEREGDVLPEGHVHLEGDILLEGHVPHLLEGPLLLEDNSFWRETSF